MESNAFSATDLGELQRQLATWRQNQTQRSRLPKEVWESAAALARIEGVSRVAQTLRLDYYKLQRLLGGVSEERCRVRRRKPQFVELQLDPAPQLGGMECRIELAQANGATMTLQVPNDPRHVLPIVEAFWSQRG